MRRLRMLALWSWMDLDDETHWDEIAADDAGPDERRLIAHVYRALDRVPIRDRVAWVLRHVEGEGLQQVAELCGCSLATAKRRIARAQEKISAALSSSDVRRSAEGNTAPALRGGATSNTAPALRGGASSERSSRRGS
jgi:RNA polymerase sigma-70 factor (ECF subfamily)